MLKNVVMVIFTIIILHNIKYVNSNTIKLKVCRQEK